MTAQIVIYSSMFVVGFSIMFFILRAIKIEKFFPKGQVFIIRLAYVLISLLAGHLFADIFLTILKFFI